MPETYRAAISDGDVYIRVVGQAGMRNVPTLDVFLRNEIEAGARWVCIDLSACTGMDSTFMGTMVGFHRRLQEGDGERQAGLVVVNPGASNRKLLDMLGLSAVVPVVDRCQAPDVRFVPLAVADVVSPATRAKLIQEAHEHLVALSDENRTKFGPFLEALRKDLQKRP